MTPARPDWRSRVERDLGFMFHSPEGAPYWDETRCYVFTAEEVDVLEAATGDLEHMCLELVDRVVKTGDEAYQRLRIPRLAWEAIERSWTAREQSLYGRFDLRFDGQGPPQLLEYNADTPTALFEAAVVQWEWLETLQAGRDQFNSLHEKLIDAWSRLGFGRTLVYFAAVKDNAEDRDLPLQGIASFFLYFATAIVAEAIFVVLYMAVTPVAVASVASGMISAACMTD